MNLTFFIKIALTKIFYELTIVNFNVFYTTKNGTAFIKARVLLEVR